MPVDLNAALPSNPSAESPDPRFDIALASPPARRPCAPRPLLRTLARWLRIALPGACLGFVCAFAQPAAPSPAPPSHSPSTPGPLSFRTDILPILTKAGANGGACHGAATGQGGFKLSLFGYDPEADHAAITRELGGRRLDWVVPEDSLLLRKGARQIEHEGGRRLRRDSESWNTLVRWISQGAPAGPTDLEVVSISASPGDTLFLDPPQSVSLQVVARHSDGTSRDVTALALYTSNDEALAEVDAIGTVRVRDRGQTGIMIRYGGQVAAVRVGARFHPETTGGWSDWVSANSIDENTSALWRRLGLEPSPRAPDLEYFRRIHLDLTGRLPTPEEIRAFVADPRPDKRTIWVDRLLASDDAVDLWTYHWGDVLLVGGKKANADRARAWHLWLREQIRTNAPLDQWIRRILTARGSTTEAPEVGFYFLAQDPRDMAEVVSSVLLGVQVACARCHNHPYDRWTQSDYHRFAAYFARLSREENRLDVRATGEVPDPKSGLAVIPKPLGALPLPDTETDDLRPPMAEWITRPDNPFFARTAVNRVWRHLLGRGLIEPVDDLRPTNPSTNPELLETLAGDFIRQGYNLRALIRSIVTSETYQRTSRPTPRNERDDRYFSRALIKPLTGVVLADAIAQATGVADTFAAAPEAARALQLPGPVTASETLDLFGRCARDKSCTPSANGSGSGGLSKALHLINSSAMQHKLSQSPWLQARTAEGTPFDDAAAVDELYLRTLSRWPSTRERTYAQDRLRRAEPKAEALQDYLWALLNSREFSSNH